MPEPRIVYLHIGLPKTGTTFLQQVVSENRPTIADQGLLYPGARVDHFLAAQDVLQHPFRGHFDERAKGTWAEIVAEVDQWPGNALISHELLALAQPAQIDTIVQAFPDHQIHLIVTARDLARQLPAAWQEAVKNGLKLTFETYVERARSRATEVDLQRGFWSMQDLTAILDRWHQAVPAQHVHLVTVPPPGADRTQLWQRYSQALAITLPPEQVSARTQNLSLGAAETEFLRRLNEQVRDQLEWPEYRRFVKQLVARRMLPRFDQSHPIALTAKDQSWAAAESEKIVAAVAAMAVTLHGELTDLVSPHSGQGDPALRESEVIEVGVRTVTQLLRRIGRDSDQGAGTQASRRSVPNDSTKEPAS